MDAMINLLELYMKYKEKGKNNKVVLEIDTLDEEYASAHKAARQYINTQKRTIESRFRNVINRPAEPNEHFG